MKRVLNLAPPYMRRRQTWRRLVRACSSAIIVAGAISGSWVVIEWSRGVAMARNLGRLQAEYAPLSRLISEQAELRATIEQLESRENLTLSLSSAHTGLPILASISRAASDPAAKVYIEQLEYLSESRSSSRASAKTTGPVVRIQGAGIDGLSVARFAERLRDCGLYKVVSIDSSRPAGTGSKPLRRFSVTCTFRTTGAL